MKLPPPRTLLIRLGGMVLPALVAAVVAIVMVAGLAAAAKVEPGVALKSLFSGAAGTSFDQAQSVLRSVPILLTGLAVAWAFRAGLFNIGAEGQFLWGALAAGWVGSALRLPPALHIPLSLLAGVVAGALWMLPAALLKTRRGTPEVVSTLLLNSVALYFTTLLANGPLHAPNEQGPRLPDVSPTAMLPRGPEDLHLGVILALLMVVALSTLLWFGREGFQVRVVGRNPETARASAINVSGVWMRTLLLSGALAGLAGAIEVLGRSPSYFEGGKSPGYGFEGIAVAILGSSAPFGVLAAGLFWGALAMGAVQLESDTGLSKYLVVLIQAVVVLAVAVRRWPRLPRRAPVEPIAPAPPAPIPSA